MAFDKTFFKFVLGFVVVLLVSVLILFAISFYVTEIRGGSLMADEQQDVQKTTAGSPANVNGSIAE